MRPPNILPSFTVSCLPKATLYAVGSHSMWLRGEFPPMDTLSSFRWGGRVWSTPPNIRYWTFCLPGYLST